jgi:hypothetical protein
MAPATWAPYTRRSAVLLNAFLLMWAAAGDGGRHLPDHQAVDAVNDPLLGMLSDRTAAGAGGVAAVRRHPFGVFFFLQWNVPPLSDAGKFWYYPWSPSG